MKGFKNFKYKYEKQENDGTATKHYNDIILFTCKNSDFNDVYTGITKIHRSILKLIPNKYIDLAGGYDNLDVVGIKCNIQTVDEKVVLLISLKNCETFKLIVTKKYLQENNNLGLLNVNPVTASIVYNDVKLFNFVLEDNHIDRNKTYNVYHNVTYHNGLSKFLNRTKDNVNNISIENVGSFVKSVIMFNGKEKIFAIKDKNIVSSTGEVLGVINVANDKNTKDNNEIIEHKNYILKNNMFFNNNDEILAVYGKFKKITNHELRLKYVLTDIKALNTGLMLYLADLFLSNTDTKEEKEIIKEFEKRDFRIDEIRNYEDSFDIVIKHMDISHLIHFKIKNNKIFNNYGKEIDILEPSLCNKKTNEYNGTKAVLIFDNSLIYGNKVIARFKEDEEIKNGIHLKKITHINKSLAKNVDLLINEDTVISSIDIIDDTIEIKAENKNTKYFRRLSVKDDIYTAGRKIELEDGLLELNTNLIEDEEVDNTSNNAKEGINDVKEDNRIYIFNDRVLLGHKPICSFVNYNKGSDSIEISEITNISEDILKIAGIDVNNHKILVPKIEFVDDELMIVHLVDNGFKCNIRFSINNGLYFGPTKVDISKKYLNIPKEYYELEHKNTNDLKEDEVNNDCQEDKVNNDLKEDEVNNDYQENDIDIETIDKEELMELIIKLRSLEILKKHSELISKLFTKEELKKKVDKLI